MQVLPSGFNYLASPYSHPSPMIRHSRFQAALAAAARLMADGHVVFSPIAHSHPIEATCFPDPKPGAFWKAQDEPLLRAASRLIVLQIDGWQESKGIQWEMEVAREIQIPIVMWEWI